MNHHLKEKRSKDEILKLLNKAFQQEEIQAKTIRKLESELEECKKRMENPREEFTTIALETSKTSFRIDYYRTSKSGPMKGIVEHLPSHASLPFVGNGFEKIAEFVGRYLNIEHAKPPQTPATSLVKLRSGTKKQPQKTGKTASDREKRQATQSAPADNDKKQGSERPFCIVSPANLKYENSLPAQAPFFIKIPSTELAGLLDKPCLLQICIEDLETDGNLCLTEFITPHKGVLRLPSTPIQLAQAGAYRVTAKLTLRESFSKNEFKRGMFVVAR